jgi:predicted MFS family arabinose efflux permease
VADDTFGRTTWGVVLAAQMAGAVVGGFLAARSRYRHALRIGVAVVALVALSLVVLAEAPGTLPLSLAMFVNGVALEQFGVAWDVSLQENIPADRLARVYSYDAMGSFIALPVGEMAVGPVSGLIGRETTLLVAAASVVAATAAALCGRDLRNLVANPPASLQQSA